MIAFTQPQPLQAAVDSVSARTPLGTALKSRHWERMPVELKRRAFFSATLEHKLLLKRMKRDILTRVKLERRRLADGKQGTYQRRGQFLEEMQELAEKYGLRPTDEKRGTLQDIGSHRRLRLIWDTQVKMAQGYAEWKTSQDEDILDAVPAQELVRREERRVPRDWVGIWRDAMAELGKDTSAKLTKSGRMVALKNDPIWTRISRFKQPWPPFDFNSGMGVDGVLREEAEKLGLLGQHDKVEPAEVPFNDGLQASTAGMDDGDLEDIRSALGENILFDDNRILWNNKLTRTDHGTESNISEDLAEQARAIAERTRTALHRVRSENDAAALPPGFDSGEREIIASTTAAALGRKQLYHDEWAGYAEEMAAVLRQSLPAKAEVRVIDGHLYVWRPDLTGVSIEEMHAMSLAGDNGKLLT